MNIKENLPLKDLTTFRIGGPAKFFIEANNREKLQEAVSFANEKKLPILIMGGGSNMLVSDRGFNGVVICPNFLGFEISGERVKIGAGENWDECVKRIIDAGLWGVENLSFIPGNAAGMAVQNAGAYGQEAANVIESVDIYDVISNFQFPISNEKCGFGYRKSIFNTTEKGKYVVLGLTLKLSKNGKPNTSYGLKQGTLSEMREQIIKIRKSKGQNPLEYKSAGSFFKNPVITEEQYAKLEPKPPKFPVQKPCPTPPSIEGGEQRGFVKVPAGFLLDKICNLKGLAVGGAKLSELQAINIVNFNHATADDVMSLFKKARNIVYQKTGIILTNEPELIGFTENELEKYFMLRSED